MVAQIDDSLARLNAVGKSNHVKVDKVPLTIEESYLASKIQQKLNFKTRAMMWRWLLSHFEEIERAKRAMQASKQLKVAQAELDAALALNGDWYG